MNLQFAPQHRCQRPTPVPSVCRIKNSSTAETLAAPAEGLGPWSVRWGFCLTQLLEQQEVVRNCPPKQPCCCGKPGRDCTPGPSEQSQQHPQAKAPGAGLPPGTTAVGGAERNSALREVRVAAGSETRQWHQNRGRLKI